MCIVNFETKNYSSSAFVWANRSDVIIVRVYKKGAKKLKDYFLSIEHQNTLSKIKNHTALVAFAKANQIQQDAVTSCPVPSPLPTTQAKGRGIQIERNRSTSCPAVTAYAPYSGKSDGKASLFIDVETTGLTANDEIVEIAIVDINENIIYQSLVKPSKPIPKKATAIHGITNKMVAKAPSFAEIWADFTDKLGNVPIIFYNASFDTRMIAQSARISFDHSKRIQFEHLFKNKVRCLMKDYAHSHAPFGRWQTLIDACYQQDISTNDVPNHRAAGDAIKTVRLYKSLGGAV